MTTEPVLLRAKHPFVMFVPPGILLALGVWLHDSGLNEPGIQEEAGSVVIGGALVWLAIRLLVALRNSLHLTATRAVGRTGLVSASSIDFPLSSIESIEVRRGPFGQLFGYGDVSIRGHGGSRTRVTLLAEPEAFRARATRLISGQMTGDEIREAVDADQPREAGPMIRFGNSVLNTFGIAFTMVGSVVLGCGLALWAISVPESYQSASWLQTIGFVAVTSPFRLVALAIAAFMIWAPISSVRDKIKSAGQ